MEYPTYLIISYNDEGQPQHTSCRRFNPDFIAKFANAMHKYDNQAYVTEVYRLSETRPLRISAEPEFGFGPPW